MIFAIHMYRDFTNNITHIEISWRIPTNQWEKHDPVEKWARDLKDIL